MQKYFELLDLDFPSKSFYHEKIIPLVEPAVEQVLESFLKTCQEQSDPADTGIVVDAGWSHRGWTARECTVIALDDKTYLPLSIKNLVKGKNYDPLCSSKGMHALIFAFTYSHGRSRYPTNLQ